MNLDFQSGITFYATPEYVDCSEYYALGLTTRQRCERDILLDSLDSHIHSSVADVRDCRRKRSNSAVGERYDHTLEPLAQTFKKQRMSMEGTYASPITASIIASLENPPVASTIDSFLLKDAVSNIEDGPSDPKASQ